MEIEQMAAPEKFMFDNSFDNKVEIIDPLEELKAKFKQKIEKAKSEAFAEGRLAGEKDALSSIANTTKETLEKIVSQEQSLQECYKNDIRKLEEKSIEFGIAAGTTLAGDLIQKTPMPLIENFFKEAFQTVHDVPQLTARLNPGVAKATIEASQLWMSETGYTGNLQFIEDETLKESDISLTWNDGGISQSIDDLMSSIRDALSNFFMAREAQFQNDKDQKSRAENQPNPLGSEPETTLLPPPTEEAINKSEFSS